MMFAKSKIEIKKQFVGSKECMNVTVRRDVT